MHAKRTRFANDIVAEFYEPVTSSNKVVVFAPGMPGMPGNKKQLAQFFNKKGYWFIYPRYRGTWESGGYFLEQSPAQDIIDVIESLEKPFQNLPDGETNKIENPELYVVGSSFGGAAALLVSSHPKVHKVLSISGVVDWTCPGKDEPLEWLYETFMPQVFGAGYRMKDPDAWKQIASGTWYNPVAKKEHIDPTKVLMIHSDDDTIVPYTSVQELSQSLSIPLITLKGKGHAGSSEIMRFWTWRKIKKYFNS